jgi:hypothetical protein
MPTSSDTFRGENRRRLAHRIREALKHEKPVLDAMRKHGLGESVIDETKIEFEPLDVSAKTVDGVVILNEKLLDGEWREILRYASHEMIHRFQQLTSDVSKEGNKDYLDQDGEIEAFRTQREVMEEMYDPVEVQRYLENLVDYHGLKGKERLEKIRELKR